MAGVGSILATVFGFVLAFRRDTRTRAETMDADERLDAERNRRWRRTVMRQVINPVRDYFAEKGEAEPVDFDRWTRYPPEDET